MLFRSSLNVTFEEFGNTVMPFAAMANDVEEHGRELYANAVAGKYGPIAAYVPPPAPAKQATVTGATTV